MAAAATDHAGQGAKAANPGNQTAQQRSMSLSLSGLCLQSNYFLGTIKDKVGQTMAMAATLSAPAYMLGLQPFTYLVYH